MIQHALAMEQPPSYFFCHACAKTLASGEVRVVPAGTGVLRTCPGCGGAVIAETSRVVQPFAKTLAGAFVWPVRVPVVFYGVGVALLCALVGLAPFGGVLAASAELGFLFLVIRRTGQGTENLEPTDLDVGLYEWIRPLLRYIGALLVSFGPAFFVLLLGGGLVGSAVAACLGALFLPAAIVVAAHSETADQAMNPLRGLSLIARIPGAYLLTVVFLVLALATHVGIDVFLREVSASVGAAAAVVLGPLLRLYPAVVCARMLGLLVREHAEEL
jgi:hypothetical protein